MSHRLQLIPEKLSPDQAARDADRAEYLERLRPARNSRRRPSH